MAASHEGAVYGAWASWANDVSQNGGSEAAVDGAVNRQAGAMKIPTRRTVIKRYVEQIPSGCGQCEQFPVVLRAGELQ